MKADADLRFSSFLEWLRANLQDERVFSNLGHLNKPSEKRFKARFDDPNGILYLVNAPGTRGRLTVDQLGLILNHYKMLPVPDRYQPKNYEIHNWEEGSGQSLYTPCACHPQILGRDRPVNPFAVTANPAD